MQPLYKPISVKYSWLHKYTTTQVSPKYHPSIIITVYQLNLSKGGRFLKATLDESRPIFQQIAEMITDDIVDGHLEEEEKVPSENELASFYNINRATVRKGLQSLVDAGIIYKRRGIGMFVKEGAKKQLLQERQNEYVTEYVRPLLDEAKRIGLSVDEVVKMIQEEEKE
jgi:GntR family transcriptional regulator